MVRAAILSFALKRHTHSSSSPSPGAVPFLKLIGLLRLHRTWFFTLSSFPTVTTDTQRFT